MRARTHPHEDVLFSLRYGRAAHRMYQHFGRATEWYTRWCSAGVVGMEDLYIFDSTSVDLGPMPDAMPTLCAPGGRVFQFAVWPRRAPHVSNRKSRSS